MQKFNVINYNINKQKFEAYDIMPYLVNSYNGRVANNKKHPKSEYFQVPKTVEEFKKFVKSESMYQFWGRCEYEIILVDWPGQKYEEKWDVFNQIMMNIDVITDILMKEVQ